MNSRIRQGFGVLEITLSLEVLLVGDNTDVSAKNR